MTAVDVDSKKRDEIAFVSSTFIEEANLEELYRQCFNVHEKLCADLPGFELTFLLQLVDHHSLDALPGVLAD